MDFITQHRTTFFYYLPFNAAFSMQTPDRFFEVLPPESQDVNRDPSRESIPMTRRAGHVREHRLERRPRLAKLDELKLAGDTIVLYFSDNGPNSWRWNVHEGPQRIGRRRRRTARSDPLAGHIPAGTRVPQIATAIDLLPTLSDLAGIRVASTKPLDGKSVKPLLLGQNSTWPDRMIFSLREKGQRSHPADRLDPQGQLFDMLADPLQDRDIAAQKPEIAARLGQAVAKWSEEMLPLVGDDRRTRSATLRPRLPARDGVPEGGIERSAGPPNCSFFTHWTSGDRMTWDIEVGRAGEYGRSSFTCRPEDVGSTLELSFGDRRVRTKLTQAHNPRLIGAEADRVPRNESYVKDFRPLSLGRISLPKGRGTLTLRAIGIPGKQVADVRRVTLNI
jgi:hypothetical protein